MKRVTYGIHATGGVATFQTLLTAAPTTAGTLSQADFTEGNEVLFTTAATANSDGGVISAFGLSRPEHGPVMFSKIRTDNSAITNVRHAHGLTSADLGAGAGPAATGAFTAAQGAWFRYDTSVDGTAFWRTVTAAGTNATVTTTTASIGSLGTYELKIAFNAAGTEVRFYVNDVLVATHTTNVPSAATTLGYTARIRTLTAAATTFRLSRIMVNQV